MRLFARAIRRSGLNVAYSQGYNPRLRLSLVLPRPVGVASRDELLVLDLAEDYRPQEICTRMAGQLPNGIELSGCFELSTNRVPIPTAAVYSLQLSQEEAADLADRINAVVQAPRLLIQRSDRRTGHSRQLDIRPYLNSIHLDGAELSFTLSRTDTGSAKPAEVLALLDLDKHNKRSQIVREKVKYNGWALSATAQSN